MDFLLIAGLTLLNALFAMAELALTASRKVRLIAMADAGDRGARAALELLNQPTQFLSTVQIGITSIGILNGIVGDAAYGEEVAEWLQSWGLASRPAHVSATALVVTLITFITIVFGELVPKRIGQLYPEPVARWVAPPMLALARLARPFVRLLSSSTALVLKLLRVDVQASRTVTEAEISASLQEGREAGVIEHHEHQMVRNVFGLDDRPLTSIMLPRADIESLQAEMSVTAALQQVALSAHSWYPVVRGSLDRVVGVISVAQLLQLGTDATGVLADYVAPPSYVPETLSGMDLLDQFRDHNGRFVLVVDEYGVVQGLLTPRDLLEAITGELQPQAQEDAWATEQPDGSWVLDGAMPVEELKARLQVDYLPDEEHGHYNTLAGLLMSVCGHLPTSTERIDCSGYTFEVQLLQGRRIERVHAWRSTSPPATRAI